MIFGQILCQLLESFGLATSILKRSRIGESSGLAYNPSLIIDRVGRFMKSAAGLLKGEVDSALSSLNELLESESRMAVAHMFANVEGMRPLLEGIDAVSKTMDRKVDQVLGVVLENREMLKSREQPPAAGPSIPVEVTTLTL